MKKIAVFAVSASLAMSAAPAWAQGTLYDDLGGQEALVRMVDDAIDRSINDPRIGHTFSESNIPRVKRLIVEQLCDISGGPCNYSGQTMEASHRGLHLDTSDFNALVENLQDAMEAEGVPFRTQNRLLALLAPMHDEVINPE